MDLVAPLLFLVAFFGSATSGNLGRNHHYDLNEEAINLGDNRTRRALGDGPECTTLARDEFREGSFSCWRGFSIIDPRIFSVATSQSSTSPVAGRTDARRVNDNQVYDCYSTQGAPLELIYQRCTFGDSFVDNTNRWIAVDKSTETRWHFAGFSIEMPVNDAIGTPWLIAEGYVAWQEKTAFERVRGLGSVCYQEEPPVTPDGSCPVIRRQCYQIVEARYFRIVSMRPTSDSLLSVCQLDVYVAHSRNAPLGYDSSCSNPALPAKCCCCTMIGDRPVNTKRWEEVLRDQCQANFNCDSTINPSRCRNAHSMECTPSALCDKSTTLCRYMRCRLKPGILCKAEDRKNWCDWPTDCTTVGEPLCKVPLRGWAFLDRVKDHCAAGLYRDVAQRCTKPPLAVCSNNSECMTGAMCVQNECKCDEDKTTVVSYQCVPKPTKMYATCSSDSDCNSFSECVFPYPGAPNKQCICHVIFDPLFNELECSIRSNMRCSEASCTTKDLLCESNYCKYKRGQVCPTPSANLCQSGTTCNNGRCRVDYNMACDIDNECMDNLKCDAIAKKCYLHKNEPCSSNRPLCTPQGYSCDTDSPSPTCKIRKGQSCSGREGDCQYNSVCSDAKLCVMSAGSSCSADSECEATTICQDGICKLDLFGDCHASNRLELCKRNTECDTAIYRCKTKARKNCVNINECFSNYECQNTVCFIKPMGNCGPPYPEADCPSGYTCDAAKICTIRLKDSCAGNKMEQCTSGTRCDPSKQNTCRVSQGRNCIVGSGADPDADCFTTLSCDAGICVGSSDTPCDLTQQNCKSGLICDIETSRCSAPRGGRCRADFDRCAKGYECNEGTCRLPQNKACYQKAEFCPDGTTCSKVDRSCKLLVGANCENLGGWCPQNTRCDVRDKKCTLREGNPCKGDGSCLYDLKCDDNICKLMIGGDCTQNASLCSKGLICDTARHKCYNEPDSSCDSTQICANNYTCDQTLKCKLNVGDSCSGSKSTHCPGGSTCDRNGNRCKLTVGTRCTNKQNLCLTDLVCDEEEYCKLNVNVFCRVQQSSCAKNHFCDSLSAFLCKLSPGKQCSDSHHCGFGFQCSGSPQTCIRKPNGACISGDKCPNKYECLGSKCKLRLNENCTDSLRDHCGGVCDPQSHICKVQYGKVSPSAAACRTGSSWNTNTHICTVGYGDSCAKEVPGGGCTGETQCDPSEGKCYVSPAGQCNATRSRCAFGLNCDSIKRKCMLRVGDTCTVRVAKQGAATVEEDDCPDNAQCDKHDSKCRFKMDAVCSGNQTTMCMVGLECDIRGRQKCRFPANADCTLSNECFDDYVCDVQKLCRISQGSQCSKTLDLCATGSACGRNSQCLCKDFAMPDNDGVCTPNQGLVFGQCKDSDDSPCDDPLAACVNDTCACNATGMVGDFQELVCKRDLGQPCFKFKKECASGSVCSDAGQCQVFIGGACQIKGKTLPCDQDGVCENGTCKSTLYGRCGGANGDSCSHQYLCDPVLKVCKRAPLKECNNLTNIDRPDCMTGSRCSDDGICTCIPLNFTLDFRQLCVPAWGRVGASCFYENPLCNAGLPVFCNATRFCQCLDEKKLPNIEENRCQLMVGEKCTQHDDCAPGMVCDTRSAFPYCRFVINQPCATSDHCMTGTRCDEFDQVCKLEQGKNCENASTSCLTGFVCSRVNHICKKQRESACDEDEDCIEAAECVERICKCNEDVAVPSLGYCEPAPTRAGGLCDANGECYDNINMECVKGVCACRPGAVHDDKDFSCTGLLSASTTDDGPDWWTFLEFVGHMLLAGVVLLVFLGIVVYCLMKRKTDGNSETVAQGNDAEKEM